jgi:uncharacterized protein (DUF697 family)
MNRLEEKRCHQIIHTAAVAAAGGNFIPVPGLGVATDIIAMTAMTMSLAAVYGGNLSQEAAKGLTVLTLKKTILKQPMKVVAKELSKLIPGAGQVVAPAMTLALIEATGWAIAKDLEKKFK